MELKEYKCKNCGAKLTIDREKNEAKCEFCNATYSIETLEKDGYEFEKGRIRAHKEENKEMIDLSKKIFKSVGTSFAVSKIIFLVVFVLAFGIIILAMIKSFGLFSKSSNIIENVIEKQTEEEKTYKKDYRFSSYTGKNSGFFLESLVEDVISNNKDEDEVEVTIFYNDTSYKTEDELKVLLKEFSNNSNKYYYVNLEYDDNKQVNKIVIEDF